MHGGIYQGTYKKNKFKLNILKKAISSIFKTKDKAPKIEEYKLTQEDEFHIPKLIHQAIENLNYLCSLANTKDDFKRLITPNPEDWKWSDDKVKARKEVWGF